MNTEQMKQYLEKDIVLKLIDGEKVEGKLVRIDSRYIHLMEPVSDKNLPILISKVKDFKGA